MTTPKTWVAERVSQAREQSPTVPMNVSGQIEQLLKDKLSNKSLSPLELKSIANSLIVDMAQADSSKPEAKQ